MNSPSYKLNNSFDIDDDKRSDLIFWNTSSMSKLNKFLEPCFFETLSFKNNNYLKSTFGDINDFPFVGYFDDDSFLDYGIYRGQGEWIIKTKQNVFNFKFGQAGDLPIVGDFDGDTKFDFVTYRSKTNTFQGILSSTKGVINFKLGNGINIPVVKDYDGDGISDFAVYNLNNGIWTIKLSRENRINEMQLGDSSFLPIPSDYDGDGKADLCVWNFKDNSIKVILTTLQRPISPKITAKIQKELGKDSFIPLQADYYGDGASELAFWNASSKVLITFDLKEDSFKKKVFHFSEITNSFPVNNFILQKFLLTNKLNKGSVVGYGNELVLWLYNKSGFISKNLNDKKLKYFKWDNSYNAFPFVSDFDGDYVNDCCLWTKDTNVFKCDSSRLGLKFALPIGLECDKPFIGNFNSDNITDIGVYRPKSKTFYIRFLGKSSPENINLISLSKQVTSKGIPQIGDYDGDNIDDFAIYDPERNMFVIKRSSDSKEIEINLGDIISKNSLVPITGDFDGDTIADPGFINLLEKKFKFYSSSLNNLNPEIQIDSNLSGQIFSADIDNDFKSDIVFLDSSKGVLNILLSSKGWSEHEEIELDYLDRSGVKLTNYTY